MSYILFIRMFNELKPHFSSFYQNLKNHMNNPSLLSNDSKEKNKEMQEKEIFIAHILEGLFI